MLGNLYQHYDGAGRVTFETYDFKGNVLEKVREVISDEAVLTVFNPVPLSWQVQAFRVSWEPPAGTSLEQYASGLLDTTMYRTSLTYDGLNRIKSMVHPQDVEGTRKVMRPRYNRAGELEHVELDETTYVEHIAYNARGQRMLIVYGNSMMTRSRLRSAWFSESDWPVRRKSGSHWSGASRSGKTRTAAGARRRTGPAMPGRPGRLCMRWPTREASPMTPSSGAHMFF